MGPQLYVPEEVLHTQRGSNRMQQDRSLGATAPAEGKKAKIRHNNLSCHSTADSKAYAKCLILKSLEVPFSWKPENANHILKINSIIVARNKITHY